MRPDTENKISEEVANFYASQAKGRTAASNTQGRDASAGTGLPPPTHQIGDDMGTGLPIHGRDAGSGTGLPKHQRGDVISTGLTTQYVNSR